MTTKGARMAPTLARAEARPSAELRMVVANISLEIMYTTWIWNNNVKGFYTYTKCFKQTMNYEKDHTLKAAATHSFPHNASNVVMDSGMILILQHIGSMIIVACHHRKDERPTPDRRCRRVRGRR